MQFVGDFVINDEICDALIELHRVCDRKGVVKRGRLGKSERTIVDLEKKDSFDLNIDSVAPELAREYGLERFYAALQACLERYLELHPLLKRVGIFRITESPLIQHYRPGGGFKMAHFERTGFATTTRMLVWMTYLNTVTEGGGTHFVYQNQTFEARKGRTLIWPSDFTHTHVGVVAEKEHKYIITGWMNFCPEQGASAQSGSA